MGDAIVFPAEEEVWQPYLMWVKGELLDGARPSHSHSNTQPSGPAKYLEQAEQSFRDAIAFATRIGTKTIQLRASTS